MDIQKDGDGPTTDAVHVPSTDWKAGLRHARRGRKRAKALVGKAVTHYPAGTPGGKGGQFAPEFASYTDGLAYIAERAKAFPSAKAYQSTPEYAAIYPALQAAYKADKAASNAEKMKALSDAGLTEGDTVSSFVGGMLAGQTMTGKVVIHGGAPHVQLPHPITVSSGGKLHESSRVRWHTGWTKSVNKARRAAELLAKINDRHEPAGSPKGGQFASKESTDGWASDWKITPGASPKSFSSYANLFTQHSMFPKAESPAWAAKQEAAAKPFVPNKWTAIHPKLDDNGKQVVIQNSTKPSDEASWTDPARTATFIPGGKAPASLNGIPLKPWAAVPTSYDQWAAVDGQNPAVEANMPFEAVPNLSVGAGLIIREPDGRIWLTRPTNSFGGYVNTFPKGTVEHGLSMQASAIKEAYEETGLQVRITGVVGDYERSTSKARFYTAERVGGTPLDMGWESQAVRVAAPKDLGKLLNANIDQKILSDLIFEGIISKRAVAFSKNFNQQQKRWPKGTPLGGQWMAFDADGLVLPPVVGSETNPAAKKKADALYGLASSGDVAGFIAAAGDIAKQVEANKKAGKDNYHSKQLEKVDQYAKQIALMWIEVPAQMATAEAADGPAKVGDLKPLPGNPGGSNPKGLYTDKSGTKLLVKGNAQFVAGAVNGKVSDDRAKNEVLAAKLMNAVIPGSAPEMGLIDLQGAHGGAKSGPGSLGVTSVWNDTLHGLSTSKSSDLKAAREAFAMHAWLANYDALGSGGIDNMKISPAGLAVNIDPGGALLFRAQGLPKPPLSDSAPEWESMRTKSSEQKAVFGGMTQGELQASAAKLGAIGDGTIKTLVATFGPGDAAAKENLANTLIARKAAIFKKAGIEPDQVIAGVAGLETVKPTPVPVPPSPLEDAIKAPSDGLPNGVTMPVFDDTYGTPSSKKAQAFYTDMAEKAKAAYLAGDMKAFSDLSKVPTGGNSFKMAWTAGTVHGKKMQAFYDSLSASMNKKMADAKTAVENGQQSVTGPDGKSWKADSEGVLQPEPNAITGATSNALTESEAERAFNAGIAQYKQKPYFTSETPSFTTVMQGYEGWAKTKLMIEAAMAGDEEAASTFVSGAGPAKYVGNSLLDAMAAKLPAPEAPKELGMDGSMKGLGDPKYDVPETPIVMLTPSTEPPPPLPAAPDFNKAMIDPGNTNATSHNAKISTIASYFENQNAKGILNMGFGTNYYAGKQVATANAALAALGSPYEVTKGQAQFSHPALTPKAVAAVKAEDAAQAAKPEAKKPTLADLTPDKLPSPPNMANFNGNGKPFSSKPWKNKSNQDAVNAIYAAALKGGMPAVEALTFPLLDGTTGQPTGQMVPASQHPSKTVVGPYVTDIANAINDFLNPPKEIRPFQAVSVASVQDAAAKFAAAQMFKTVASAAKEHQLGFWLALGQVQNPADLMPQNSFSFTPEMKAAGHVAYNTTYSSLTKKYIDSVLGSGAINRAYDKGEKTFGSFDLKKTAQALYNDASELPEGSKLYKWIGFPPHMLEQLKTAPIGTVFQSGGGMCTSIHPTATSGFGQYKMTATVSKGAKGVYSYAKPNNGVASEQEITIVPGQRFMITGRGKNEKGTMDLQVIMLPLDPKWIA